MKKISIILLLSLVTMGCSIKPWVKSYERHHLADPVMNKGRNPVSAAYTNHVYQAREGARGSESTQGVGCGCN